MFRKHVSLQGTTIYFLHGWGYMELGEKDWAFTNLYI